LKDAKAGLPIRVLHIGNIAYHVKHDFVLKDWLKIGIVLFIYFSELFILLTWLSPKAFDVYLLSISVNYCQALGLNRSMLICFLFISCMILWKVSPILIRKCVVLHKTA